MPHSDWSSLLGGGVLNGHVRNWPTF
jgi:hypothetical protein